MRRYKVTEKIFAIQDGFKVTDENDKQVYNFKSKLLDLGDDLIMNNLETGEEYLLDNKIFKIFAEYRIKKNGKELAKVKRKFAILGTKFEITTPAGNYSIQGSLFDYNFSINDESGNTVTTVSKKYFAIRDTYGVEIADNVDHDIMIAIVVIIDQVLHDANRRAE